MTQDTERAEFEKWCNGLDFDRLDEAMWYAYAEGRKDERESIDRATPPEVRGSAEPFAYWWMDHAGNEGMSRLKPAAPQQFLRGLFTHAEPAKSAGDVQAQKAEAADADQRDALLAASAELEAAATIADSDGYPATAQGYRIAAKRVTVEAVRRANDRLIDAGHRQRCDPWYSADDPRRLTSGWSERQAAEREASPPAARPDKP